MEQERRDTKARGSMQGVQHSNNTNSRNNKKKIVEYWKSWLGNNARNNTRELPKTKEHELQIERSHQVFSSSNEIKGCTKVDLQHRTNEDNTRGFLKKNKTTYKVSQRTLEGISTHTRL